MPRSSESLRHQLMGPLSRCLAKVFLFRHQVKNLELSESQLKVISTSIDECEKEIESLRSALDTYLKTLPPPPTRDWKQPQH